MKKLFSLILSTLVFVSTTSAVFAADTVKPGDVDSLTANAADASVKLTWSKATDDVGVTGYRVYYGMKSVTKQGETYDQNVDVKDVQEYTVSGLANGTKYYFTVIAYDAAGNESESWAPEASATPAAGSGSNESASSDKDAPQVSSAEATFKTEVKVVFSEAVVLPATDPQEAFTIENNDTFEPLAVSAAKMDETDKTNSTVLLTTDSQLENAKYKLTVGIDVKDVAGNPIISGTSDTALFDASNKEKTAGAADTTGPVLATAEAANNTHIVVNFNETVVLSIDPSENFQITGNGDNKDKKLEVLGVKLGANSTGVEDASAIITTSAQEKIQYVVKVVKLKDEAGNVVSDSKNSAIFQGVIDEEPAKDLIPPKDVADFLAKVVVEAKKHVVKLSWKNPAENNDDTKEQILYMSADKGSNYDKKDSLKPEVSKYEVKDLQAGEYWFKITQKDAAGNESNGVVAKVVLSKTGPEMMGLLLVSVWLGRIVTRRKKK